MLNGINFKIMRQDASTHWRIDIRVQDEQGRYFATDPLGITAETQDELIDLLPKLARQAIVSMTLAVDKRTG